MIPEAARGLVAAIMQQGVEDVLAGDPTAVAWLEGADFTHWSQWLDIDPDRARQAIDQRRASRAPHYKAEDLQRVRQLRESGQTWRDALIDVFGYYSETLRLLVKRQP